MSYHHMAELLSWNPARRFGLGGKGDTATGYDADLAILDPARRFHDAGEIRGPARGLYVRRPSPAP